MQEESELIELLTEVERETLRAFLARSEVKEVARALGKSTFAVEQRLARARRKLGVRRSIDAALMLARAEGVNMYGSPIYALSDVAPDDPDGSTVGPVEEGRWFDRLPFPGGGERMDKNVR
ncbi:MULTISPECIES: LuxR C-terminal-related transcriptional regulator [unclassified Sphingomonas]|uniref:LuxR C-terminal-related transcriptional regulator n=1 Tax=unclassified Sphingomonas TaxID=196159 RepID=UPI0006FA306C|nr:MULTISPECIES: LuxR C-terminal-related transcriptional regulator [unclassified Sphingomonas]KRB92931.1 hypothetical protein ASE22_25885 [Sphingomonas sp. Root720]